MRWLLTMVRVIGQALGITPAVGRAHQTQDSQTGGNNSIVEQPKSANKGLKPKRKAVKAAILAPSPTAETLCVPTRTKKSSTTGTSQATPARQSAKLKPKRKSSAAPSTTAAASRKPAQKPAQTTSGKRGRPRKTPV